MHTFFAQSTELEGFAAFKLNSKKPIKNHVFSIDLIGVIQPVQSFNETMQWNTSLVH